MILRSRTALLCGGLLLAASMSAQASEKFTLGRFIPADSWMFINSAPNPENAWLDEQWAEIFAELKATGIDRDFVNIILSLVPEQDHETAQATLDRAGELVGAVRWTDLFGGEIAFAERMTSKLPGYEYIFLAQGAGDSNKHNVKALAGMLFEIATLTDKVELSESKTESGRSWTLKLVEGTPAFARAPQLTLFLKNGVLGATFGFNTAQDVIALMDGKPGLKSIVDLPRYKTAVSEVRAPEDSLMYFDIKTLLGGIQGMLTAQISGADGGPNAEQQKEQVGRIIETLFEIGDVVDYSVASMETDGVRQLTHSLTRLQEDKMDTPVARAFLERKVFDQFDKYIPASATGFSMSTTIDFGALYDVAISFVEDKVPDGPAHVAKWREILQTVGLDPHRDVFAWLSGEIIQVSLPSAMVSPMSSGDSVMMIRVKDPELAAAKVRSGIGFVEQFLQNTGQSILVAQAPGLDEGFVELTHPLLMMFVKPVVGVRDEWLMIGTSSSAVNKCLDVAAGKAPSILKNKRFVAEGLVPTGPVLSASFADTSKFGQELGAAMGMVSLFGGGAIASIPDYDPDAKRIKGALKQTMGIVLKLAPVLQKIDFYSSQSSITMRRGAVVRNEKVVTYKKPKKQPETATAEATP